MWYILKWSDHLVFVHIIKSASNCAEAKNHPEYIFSENRSEELQENQSINPIFWKGGIAVLLWCLLSVLFFSTSVFLTIFLIKNHDTYISIREAHSQSMWQSGYGNPKAEKKVLRFKLVGVRRVSIMTLKNDSLLNEKSQNCHGLFTP